MTVRHGKDARHGWYKIIIQVNEEYPHARMDISANIVSV